MGGEGIFTGPNPATDTLVTTDGPYLSFGTYHAVNDAGDVAFLALRDAVQRLGRPPILALTATATPQVSEDVLKQLGMDQLRQDQEDSISKEILYRLLRPQAYRLHLQ